PPPADYIELGIDQEWTELIPVIGNLARVFQQDSFNLPKVQKGLETFKADGLTLTKYQEIKIRHWHSMAERFIAN
ncbi:MAG: aromatic ring-hydroxylating dioxygenase subunit alpha, partial [Actinomycetota bacterium]|nr:aromatic ring-hydroxylating dioxygenase subunit alpha [Actinomycetota bacterium]